VKTRLGGVGGGKGGGGKGDHEDLLLGGGGERMRRPVPGFRKEGRGGKKKNLGRLWRKKKDGRLPGFQKKGKGEGRGEKRTILLVPGGGLS